MVTKKDKMLGRRKVAKRKVKTRNPKLDLKIGNYYTFDLSIPHIRFRGLVAGILVEEGNNFIVLEKDDGNLEGFLKEYITRIMG